MIQRDEFGFCGQISKEEYEAHLREHAPDSSGSESGSVRCTRCGRYTDHAQYYESKPYGPACIRLVQGAPRPTRDFTGPTPHRPSAENDPQATWFGTAWDIAKAAGALALLILIHKERKK